jgi:hypothetical protein
LTTLKYNSFPSGENVGYVSSLVSNETILGAKTSGVSPGGVCPRYAAAAGMIGSFVLADSSGHKLVKLCSAQNKQMIRIFFAVPFFS